MQLSSSKGKSYLFNFGVQHSNAEKLYGILKDAAASPTSAAIEQPKSRSRAAAEIRKATSSFQQQQQIHGAHGGSHSAPIRLSAASGVDPKTTEGRKSLLQSDPQLKETYDNLGMCSRLDRPWSDCSKWALALFCFALAVKGGIVTEADFWHSRSRELQEEQVRIDTGVEECFGRGFLSCGGRKS